MPNFTNLPAFMEDGDVHVVVTRVCREHEIEPGDKISKKPFKRYPIIATKGPPRITRGFLWMGALGGRR